MMCKLSTILFLVGFIMSILITIKVMYSKEKLSKIVILLFVTIVILEASWILEKFKNKEKYEYENAYKNGKIISGTVYADYPQEVGGLGWVL
jgi:c-di-AMP phosphodiesterase-like protein